LISDAWPRPREDWPDGIWSVPYVSGALPTDSNASSWLSGSNCQRFAYGVLNLFGRRCPPLRSSELWDERSYTVHVEKPDPLDLVLFNGTDDPFGAHLGVWMASDEILHLCKEVGTPTVWSASEFQERPRYRIIVGYKRVLGSPN
jgi:hypothetical protein